MAKKPTKKTLLKQALKKTRGGVASIPRAGDEIVVSFQSGELRKPLVTGSLWNSDSPPPTERK